MIDDKPYVGWIIQLFGNTSKATKHLADVHARSSAKSDAEATRKRTRQQQLDRVLDSIPTTNDSRRMTLLIETLRIVRNNLPYRLGEYDESELLADLTVKPEFRATINPQTVGRAIVELYASSKMRAIKLLVSNRITGVGSLAMVVDFLSCKTQPGVKYLGLRVFFIDNKFKLTSILLGTRHFEPLYGEQSQGYRTPFKRWIIELLNDFGLTLNDFNGSTTDADPDVRWMIAQVFRCDGSGAFPIFPIQRQKWHLELLHGVRTPKTLP
ncbi:unnamed protein product [Phytophthora fragariaefolia]|uniref:Unnamed protein product n=1 Tax=Phytophthora fragariaefolia TaxID=1490495 RepID=A0A9W6YBM9_9STRA|nr:unnamed protein product [Phytophthora fragariaefolia]